MLKISYLKIAFVFFLLSTTSFAQPPDQNVRGRLVFLGVTNDSSKSVWLSVTTAGSFKLEAQGQQLIDTWDMFRRGIHLSLSPIVSQGNGGTHFLINRLNDRRLDSQNQKGGIVFPPLPSEPPSVMPPIVVFPEHPIVIPPGTPPSGPTPPTPEHPIVIPPSFNQPPTQSVEVQPDNTSGSVTTNINEPGDTENKNQEAPITKARQFDQETAWNIWSDNYYFNTNDERNDLDAKGTTTNFVIGTDRHIAPNFVLGALLSLTKYHYNAFDGDLKNQASGFTVGPYFGYNISPHWSLEGTLTYGQLQNNNDIASLNSEYRTQLFHTDLHATGLYQFGNFQLRPKPLISFTHFRNPAYAFNGVFNNQPFQVNRAQESFNFDFAEFRLESNYSIETQKGNLIQPYAEPGIDYAFARPNDGQILTGNLDLASTAPVTETLTIGVRALFSRAFLLDASGSYLSFGQHGLDVWEVRLLGSYSFG